MKRLWYAICASFRRRFRRTSPASPPFTIWFDREGRAYLYTVASGYSTPLSPTGNDITVGKPDPRLFNL